MKPKRIPTTVRGALIVPAAALMLGAAEAGSTVALNFQSWYYDSGTTPQTVGFGAGYQTTGLPVTAKAFGVEPANWVSADPMPCSAATDVSGLPVGGLTLDVVAANLWQSGLTSPGVWGPEPGVSWYDSWPDGTDIQVQPGNYEVAWSYLDNTGWSFTLHGLDAKFPSGYVVALIGSNKTKSTSWVQVVETTNMGQVADVTFSVLPDSLGIGVTPTLTDDSITFSNPSRDVSATENCALAGFIVTDKPVVTYTSSTSQVVVVGSPVTFTALAAGIGTLSYQWKFNGVDIPGDAAKLASYTIGTTTSGNSGNYTVTVTSSQFPAEPATSEILPLSVVTPTPVTWDADPAVAGAQDGAGTWNSTSPNFLSGTTNGPWVFANPVTFGSGGTGTYDITLGESITAAGGMTFASGTYQLAPAAGQTLTLQGTSPITTTGNASISANIDGTEGFTKQGAGTLTLTGDNNPITGPVVVNAGTLSLSRGGGGTALTVNSGATAYCNYAGSIGYQTNCFQLNVNGGTFALGAPGNGVWAMDTNLNNATLTAVSGANWSFGGGSTIDNEGSSTLTGGTLIMRESNPGDVLPIVNSGSFTINCPIDGSNRTLQLSGGGITTLTGAASGLFAANLEEGTLAVSGRLTGSYVNLFDDTTLKVSSVSGASTIDLTTDFIVGENPAEPAATPNTLTFAAVSSSTTAPISAANVYLDNPVVINIESVTPYTGVYPLLLSKGGYSDNGVTLGTLPSGITANLINDLENSGLISLEVTAVSVPDLVWTGAASGAWDTTSANWSAGLFQTGALVTFDDTATNTAVTLAGAVSPGSLVIGNDFKDYSFSGSGRISGMTGLTKTGAGTLSIATNNDFTGEVSLSGGGVVTVGTGGTSGSLGGTGPITLDATDLVFNRSDDVALDRAVVGSAGMVVKDGPGTLTMSASGNTADIVVNSGTLVASGGSFGASFAAGKTLTINTGATLSTPGYHSLGSSVGGGGDVPTIVLDGGSWLLAHEQYVQTLTMNAGTTSVVPGNDGIRTLSGSVVTIEAAAASSTIGSPFNLVNAVSVVVADGDAADDLVISGLISNSGALTKSGPGRLLISGTANTYSGATIVTEGTLAVLGTSIPDANRVVIDGGKLDLTGNETVATLFFGASQQDAGTWGATGSGAAHIDDTRFSGSGILTVVTGPPANGFPTWIATFGLPAEQQGAMADPDQDGIPNLLEYVLNGNPTTAGTAILPVLTTTDSSFVFSFNQRAESSSGLTQVFQYTSDLATWTNVGITAPTDARVTIGAAVDGVQPVTVTIPKSLAVDGKLMGRLQVVAP